MSGHGRTFVRNDYGCLGEAGRYGGSREHYFHFLLGYLLPLVHVQFQLQHSAFEVLECGPLMTPILDETLQRLGLPARIVPHSAMVDPLPVEAWDHGWSDLDAVRATVDRIRRAWCPPACPQPDCPASEKLLLQRSPAPAYYLSGAAEKPGYGTSRRTITNGAAVSAHLSAQGIDHAIYEPGRHSLGCQIASFRRARRIVGIRGAEWANVIWSCPGLAVRMYDPAPPARLVTALFERTAVRHEIAVAGSALISVDPSEVARFLQGP